MIELSPKWRELSNDTRYALCLGGRASGKSFSVAFYTIMKTFELNRRILYTRKTMTSAHLSIIPQLKEVIVAAGLEDAFTINNAEIINKHTGSTIYFKGLTTSSGENTAALKSLTGVSLVVLDEAEELNDEVLFDKMDFSVRAKGEHNKIILIMNPTTKEHWTYDRFYVNPKEADCTIIETTYLDNIDHVSDSFIARAELMKKKAPKQYSHVFLGAWRERAEGVIFTNWTTGEFPGNSSILSRYGLDFGFKDPDAMCEVKVDKTNNKMYVKELIYSTELTETELIDKIKKVIKNDGIIYADSANPKVIKAMGVAGLPVRPSVKGADSIRAGIKTLQDYELIIDPSSYNLIKELNNYVWDDKKSEVPIDDFNHILDGLRYATRDLSLKPIISNY